MYIPRTGAAERSAEKEVDEVIESGELVLVVEDEPALRQLAVLSLERLGYQATEAADGDEAVRLIEQEGMRPALILTDVVMPGMSGRALVDRLRASVPGVKVIFMSGYADDKLAEGGILGADIRFLQKPFSMGDLAAMVKTALAG